MNTRSRTWAARAARNRGFFSLVEFTVATFVLTLGVAGTTQLYHVGMVHLRALSEGAAAADAVQNELETLRALPFAALENTDERPFRSASPALANLPKARGAVSIKDAASGGLPRLKEVTVRLEWLGPGGRTRAESLTTLIADKGREGVR